MSKKNELMNTILSAAMGSFDGNTITELKNILRISLYDYSVEKITTTDISVGNYETTQGLLEYFTICKLSSGRSHKTIKQYLLVANQLCSLVHKELGMITSEDVIYFLAKYPYTKTPNISQCTMDSKRRYLSSIFGLLKKHKKIDENPMDMVESLKCPCKVKEQFTDQEIHKLYKSINDCKNNIVKHRNNAILSLSLDTGCRVSELTNINIRDCNFQSNEIKVKGKGNKERVVYFSKLTKDKIFDYLKFRNIQNYNINIPLFMDICNKNRLKSSGVRSMLKRIGLVSGVNNVHPHRLRRTCATNLVLKGIPIDTISRYLGHSTLDTVQRYVVNSNQRMKSELQRVGIG
jgi:site-specific recombinase XerD